MQRETQRSFAPVGVLVGVLFALVVAAGCGTRAPSAADNGGSAPGTPSAPPASSAVPRLPVISGTVPIASLPPSPRTSVPPAQVDTTSVPGNKPAGVQVLDNGTVVTFTAEQSGCQQVGAQVTEQSATRVVIQVITTTRTHTGMMCPMIVREVPIAVQLAAPLGSRTLVFQAVAQHG